MQALTGFAEASAGTALAPTPFAPLGAAMLFHGSDRFAAGAYMAMTGKQMTTGTSQLLQKMGMSHERADRWDDNANLFGILGAGGLAYKLGQEAVASFRLPSHFMPSINRAIEQQPKYIANKISGHTMHGLNQSIGRDGGKGVSARAILDAIKYSEKTIPQAKGAIKYVGKDATVILNSDGKIITTFGKARGPQIWDKSGVVQPYRNNNVNN